jgi:hypothetical protein
MLLFLGLNSFAQEKDVNHLGKSVLTHQVSGVVLDSLGSPLAEATIFLKSSRDSVTVRTGEDGIFVFEQLKEASFSIRVSFTGYKTHVGKYFFDQETRIIVLEPITLANQFRELKEVLVNGTPTIKYKKDTVEYRASDYKVRQYANVSELLKQMEGMELAPDGKLFFHGEQVKSAKLNGREFAGGDVKNALENLPADIVDKIQIVDDFGEIAAKTGVKSKAAQKTLNVTTQADKSIANIALVKAQVGTSGRYNEQASLENISGNRVLAVTENFKRTVSGINSTDANNTSTSTPDYVDVSPPGKTTIATPGISYTNDSGNGFSYVGSYNFSYDRKQLNTQTTSQLYSTSGSTFSTANTENDGYSRVHQAHAKVNYEISKFDFFQLLADFANTNDGSREKIESENFSDFTSGQQHFKSTIQNALNNEKSDFKITGIYVRSFKKPRRFLSVQLSVNPATRHQTDNKGINYQYFRDSLNSPDFVDSVSHLNSQKAITATTSELTFIYGEPLKSNSLLEFYANIRNTSYSNTARTDTVFQDGQVRELLRLRNEFNYDFMEGKFFADYHYTTGKADLVLGAGPYWTNIKRHLTGQAQSAINNFTFALLPVLSYTYAWSKMERFDLEYNESTIEPTAQQLQPYTDNTDPNNIIIGNPAIKSTFIHNLSAS